MKKNKIKISEQVAQLETDREWLYNQNVGLRLQLLASNKYITWTLAVLAIAGWINAIVLYFN